MLLLQLRCNNAQYIINTFFQYRDVDKYNWCRDSSSQRSLNDFCIVSTELFRLVLDVRVKKGEEHITNQHLLVCIFLLEKLTAPETNDHD